MPPRLSPEQKRRYYKWFKDFIAVIEQTIQLYEPDGDRGKQGTGTSLDPFRYRVKAIDGGGKFLCHIGAVPTKSRVNMLLGTFESRLRLPKMPIRFGHKVYKAGTDFSLSAFDEISTEIAVDLITQTANEVGAVPMINSIKSTLPTTVGPKRTHKPLSSNSDKMVFLNVGWMKYYRGLPSNGDDKIINGGAFVKQHKYGHEIFNFLPFSGKYYGYVQALTSKKHQHGYININNLGAKSVDDTIGGILAVFVAKSPDSATRIVGWYKNSSVYRLPQEAPKNSNRLYNGEEFGYFLTTNAENATFLPVEARSFVEIPRGEGAFGQSNVWYGGGLERANFRHRIRDFIQQYESDENEEFYQTSVDSTEATALIDGPVPRSEPTQGSRATRWQKNPAIAKGVIQKNGYVCAIDAEHISFTSRLTGKNYVEAHHLIPMSNQDRFENSLDVQANIVILCPNCHRLIHHAIGEEARSLLTNLYDTHSIGLTKQGIGILLNQLIHLYNI